MNRFRFFYVTIVASFLLFVAFFEKDIYAQYCTGGKYWCGLASRDPPGCGPCGACVDGECCNCDICVAGNPEPPFMGDCSAQTLGTCGLTCEQRGMECGVSSPCYWVGPTNTPVPPTLPPGTTPLPTTPPASCPACCWAGTGQGTHYSSLDYLCAGLECWDSCYSGWPERGQLRVWVFYDSNRNGQFDVNDQTLPSDITSSAARLRFTTLSNDNNVIEFALANGLSGVWRNVTGSGLSGLCGGSWSNFGGCGSTENEVCCYANPPPTFFGTCWGLCGDQPATASDGWGSTPRAGDVFFQWHPFWGIYYGYTDRMVSFDWNGNIGPHGSAFGTVRYEVINLPSQYQVTVIKSQDPRDVNNQTTVYNQTTLTENVRGQRDDGTIVTELVVIGIGPTLPSPTPVPNPPSYHGFNIRNSNGTIVNAETGNRNHVCQDAFRTSSNPRQVNFEVTILDIDGATTINNISMRFRVGASTYLQATASSLNSTPNYQLSEIGSGFASLNGPTLVTNIPGFTRTVTFPIVFDGSFDEANDFRIHDLQLYATDTTGQVLNWTDTLRDFRVWDCQVPVAGSLYDGMSQTGLLCPDFGSNMAGADMNFLSLDYTAASGDVGTNVSSPNYDTGANGLTWGETYLPVFNASINGSDPRNSIRINSTGCDSGSFALNGTYVDPYGTINTVDVDYLTDQNQDAWYQCRGQSVLAGAGITSMVPITCALNVGCSQAVSIDNGGYDNNGLLVSSSISTSNGCSWCPGTTCCQRGLDNDWYKSSYSQNLADLNYEKLYTDLYTGKGVGRLATNWSQVTGSGGTGLVFVNGDLVIDTNNSVAVGQFLMVVVSGSLTINNTVDNVEGAFLVDGDIATAGQSANQLLIEGMLYAGGGINFGRSLTPGTANNLTPAVAVVNRPDLIFNAPSYMFERVNLSR